MISVQVNHEPIDINGNTSFNIAGASPFISPGEISGPKIYNLSARKTRKNQRIFSFAEKLNNTNRQKEFDNTIIKFYNLLWKRGTLKLRDFSGNYNLSFHTDAGDIGLKIKNLKLSEMDLGTAASDRNTSAIYPEANHVHFLVHAPDFYGENNLDYEGEINALNSSGYLKTNSTNNTNNIIPFPFLLYVLNRVFQQLGYLGIEGEWTEDEHIKRVVLFNNYDLASMNGTINEYASTIQYNNHVPDISVGSFLIDTAIFFGITYIINPITKKVQIRRIKDWINNTDYLNFNGRASGNYKLEPNRADGFLFKMKPNSNDPLLENYPSWLQYQAGNGGEPISTDACLLQLSGETPYTRQKGTGPAFGLEENSRSPLTFLLSTGPGTGHYLRTGFSLRWDGADGIIARCYQEWIDWKNYTESVEREVDMNVVELLQLDLERKIMIDNLKYVVGDFSGTISNDGKRKPVKLQLYSVRK